MNFVKAATMALVVVWLQLAFLPLVGLWGVVPNLAMVVVIVLAARVPAGTSLLIAATIGWLLDVGAGSDYGLRTAFYVLVALVTVTLSRMGSDLDNLSLVASLVAGATIIYNLAILANLAFLQVSIPAGYVSAHIVAEVMMNLIMLIPVRWLIGKVIGRKSSDIVVGLGSRLAPFAARRRA